MTEIAFRPLNLGSDVTLVHRWMREPHVARWWQLDGPREVVSEYLTARHALSHLDMWIVSDAGTPFAYVETYRIPDDPLASRYAAEPGDRGFRLLVGPPELLGSGIAQRLVSQLVARLLEQVAITRVLCETDAANTRMLTLCRALGGEEVTRLDRARGPSVLLGWRRAPH